MGQNLEVEISNIKSAEGQLIISFFPDSRSFLKDPCYEKYIPIKSMESVRVTLSDLPKGEYALCVIHDKNKNGRIDTGLLKIPREPYGFSLNPKPGFGPPKFQAASFNFQDDLELKIILN